MIVRGDDRQLRRRVLEITGNDATQVDQTSARDRFEDLSMGGPDSSDLSNPPEQCSNSLASKLANCGGRMIRFLGDKDQFLNSARQVFVHGGYDPRSRKQVHLLEPLDWLGLLPAESLSGVVPRLKRLLDERQELARHGIVSTQRELTRLSKDMQQALEADDCYFDTKSANPAYQQFPEREAFKRTIESVLSSDVVVVQPIICPGNDDLARQVFLSYLRVVSQGSADNVVWLIVLPKVSGFFFNECLNELTSGTIQAD